MASPTEFDRRTMHFGTVTAALSHDLGNALATLQEAAGLIDDYVVGAAEGEVIEVVHLEPVLGRIDRSIARGLKFAQLLNWIAHSIDHAQFQPDLAEVIERAAESARYFARQRCVDLEVVPTDSNGPVNLPAIDLHILLFSCLRFAAGSAVEGAVVQVQVVQAGRGRQVTFRVSETCPDWSSGEELRRLAEESGAHLEWDSSVPAECRFSLILPAAEEPSSMDRMDSSVDR